MLARSFDVALQHFLREIHFYRLFSTLSYMYKLS